MAEIVLRKARELGVLRWAKLNAAYGNWWLHELSKMIGELIDDNRTNLIRLKPLYLTSDRIGRVMSEKEETSRRLMRVSATYARTYIRETYGDRFIEMLKMTPPAAELELYEHDDIDYYPEDTVEFERMLDRYNGYQDEKKNADSGVGHTISRSRYNFLEHDEEFGYTREFLGY